MKRFALTFILTAVAVFYAFGAEHDVVLTKERMQIPCSIIEINGDSVCYYVWSSTNRIQHISLDNISKIYWQDGAISDFSQTNPPIALLSPHINPRKPSEHLSHIQSDSTKQDSVALPMVSNDVEEKSDTSQPDLATIETTTEEAPTSDEKPVVVVATNNDISSSAETIEEDIVATDITIEPKETVKKGKPKTHNEKSEHDIVLENTLVETGYILSDIELMQKALAKVHKYAGIYIFNDNEPICDYTILGRCKVGVSWSSEYEGVRNHLVKKTLKDYPNADAVILDLSDGGTDLAVAIKFDNKEEKSKWGYAKVESFNGLLVFSDCEPINNYTIIGRSKSAMTWSGQYDSVKANLIKKALKKMPNATGIIIDTQKGGVDRGVILTFQ